MNLNQLIKHPELLLHYLEWSPGNICIIFNRSEKILDCNRECIHQLQLADKPLGRNLRDILTDNTNKNFTYYISDTLSSPIPNFFNSKNPERTFVSYIYKMADDTFCLLGLSLNTEKNIIENFSLLNNELATMSMELKKKNSELKMANAKINELSRVDPLTQLYNRRYLQEHATHNISESSRHNYHLSVIMADLDDFKKINDSYGHGQGDSVLREFAKILRAESRAEDIAARIGGEEFVVLLPHTESAAAFSFAERIRKKLEKSTPLEDKTGITASFGITEMGDDKDFSTLLSRADKALYQAKNQGKNRSVIFNL